MTFILKMWMFQGKFSLNFISMKKCQLSKKPGSYGFSFITSLHPQIKSWTSIILGCQSIRFAWDFLVSFFLPVFGKKQRTSPEFLLIFLALEKICFALSPFQSFGSGMIISYHFIPQPPWHPFVASLYPLYPFLSYGLRSKEQKAGLLKHP